MPIHHRPYTETCSAVDLQTTEELLDIGHLAMQELNLTYSRDFVTLHLRRGDSAACDTSPERVVDYLNCSLMTGTDHDEEEGVRNVVVLTNGDDAYCQDLEKEFYDAFPRKRLIFLDRLVRSYSFVEKLSATNIISEYRRNKVWTDNCFLFNAEKTLLQFAQFHLERGRAYCKPCDPGGSKSKWAFV